MAVRTTPTGALALWVSGLVLGLALAAAPARAGSDADPRPSLDPEARKEIRGVARSVLVARGQAAPSVEARAIREQVDQLRKHLQALAAPIRQPLAAAPAGGGATPAPAPSWHDRRRSKIRDLERSLDTLDERCRALRATRQAQPRPLRPLRPLATGASDAALGRLEQLRGEVDQALQLPEGERHARLTALAKELRIRSQAIEPVRKPEPSQPPPFRNRTQHR